MLLCLHRTAAGTDHGQTNGDFINKIGLITLAPKGFTKESIRLLLKSNITYGNIKVLP